MDINDLKIGIDATFFQPFKQGINTIKLIEQSGFNSVFFGDHLMGLFPESLWTPDIISAASVIESPHQYYETFTTMAMAASNTKKVTIGTGVTEVFRHHPAVLAQTILTLDHISRGRVILGLGAGEGENIIPYGIKMEKPVSRLDEALTIIKLLWENYEKVDFDGKFWTLKDAVLTLKPFKKRKYPPIWVAAHGPQMLELAGKHADGWYPTKNEMLTPNIYQEKFNVVKNSAKKAGRDPDKIIPAMWSVLIVDDSPDEVERMSDMTIAKFAGLFLTKEHYETLGLSYPFGEDYSWLKNFIPTRYDRKTMLEIIAKVPKEAFFAIGIVGTPDDVIDQIEKYAKIGLKHIVFWNLTYVCDLTKLNSSHSCLIKVLEYFRDQK